MRFPPLPFAFVVLLALTASPGAAQESQRALTVDDLFRMEQLGTVMGSGAVFSPDGEQVAFVRVRPGNTATHHNQPYLWANDHADVWLASTDGGTPVNLTRGASDGSGYWNPRWSPDGRHLTMYCADGDNVHACVWSRGDETVRRMSPRGVPSWAGDPLWLGADQVVFPVLPEGERAASIDILKKTPRTATEEWPKVREGKEATSSVLESGLPREVGEEARGRLVVYDVTSGENDALFEGDVRHAEKSPAEALIAGLIQVGFVQMDPAEPLRHLPDQGVYRLQLFDEAGARSTEALEAVSNVLPSSLRWSPDGAHLAFVVLAAEDDASPFHIFVLTPADGELRRYSTAGLDPSVPAAGWNQPPRLVWSGGNHLLMQARGEAGGRRDWWLLREHQDPENVTAALDDVPESLHATRDGDSWVGVARGDVWSVAVGGEARNLTEELSPEVTGFAWTGADDAAEPLEAVIVSARAESGEESFHSLDVSSGRAERVPTPAANVDLVAASAPGGHLAFHQNDRNGTVLWLNRAGSASGTKLFEANTFLQEIARAESRLIEYRSLEGDSLEAWIILPAGYQEGTRLPMVAWVYAGSVVNPNRPSSLTELNNPHPLNLQLLPAQGYAVLLPSMPLRVQGTDNDPYMELRNGVVPAVQKAIDLGFADPDRLAVMGQSYGGYSTMGLITQTDLFRSAISLAGLSDLVSLYGQLGARERYEDDAHEDLFTLSISETGQVSMGSPPWEDLERYTRNSPLTYVHRVETPILIIQGDLDYVAIQQGEQFFMSLLRQNKRARFVRYWGEGHVLSSPANIRDMWEQIHAWLAETMGPDTEDRDGGSGGG